MASTYSDLKIELIGTGDQNNTWGTTTNTNLGTALEEAIVGRANANFTTDSDLTITLSNTNGSQVARNYILDVTSSVPLTATKSLIVPTINKPYIIENNTLGSQDILVKSAAGAGVTVPNGYKVMVYCDGTDVVQAQDYIPTLVVGTLAAVTLVNTVPVANGGTGATTASGARTNLDVPSTTGTGASGNWAINAATASTVSATLIPAKGGTGITSVGTAGNVLTSDGTNWVSSAPAAQGFPSGTRMSFNQTSAPTGWTKDTSATIDDSILRLVTGSVSSGGSTAFSTWNATSSTGAYTLSTAEIPSHSHSGRVVAASAGDKGGAGAADGSTGSTGGGGSHAHSLTTDIKYYDFIVAQKN